MLRISTMLFVCLLALALSAQAALACDTCGCKDKAAAGAACENCPKDGNCENCPNKGKCADCDGSGKCADCPSAKAASCAGCAKADSGTCTKCAELTLTSASAGAAAKTDAAASCEACAHSDAGMCLDCSVKMMAAEMPCMECGGGGMCDHKQGMVDRVKSKYNALNVSKHELDATEVAYMATTVSGDIEGTFMDLMGQAGAQGLFSADSHVYSVYPTAMSEGYMLDTPLYCAVTVEPGTEVSAPVASFTVPAGNYLVIDHVGPYMELDATWLAAFAYTMQNGLELDYTGICFEDYVSDPESTPEAELLTQIYLPIAPAKMDTAEGEMS